MQCNHGHGTRYSKRKIVCTEQKALDDARNFEYLRQISANISYFGQQ